MSQARIPVTVVTGFLGAGKTTLLSNLIHNSQERRLAILVNEFGAVSIDGSVLRAQPTKRDVEIHDLARGLVAYDDDQDFLPTMLQLWQRRQQIDHVVIETSGLALPSAAMAQLQSPQLANYFVLDATLAVVDTPLLLAGDFAPAPESPISDASASLFEQQLAHADIVVLNKIDDLNNEALLQAEGLVRQAAPSIRFIELAYQAKLDARLTLGLYLHQATAEGQRHYGPVASMPAPGAIPLGNQGRLDGHSHSGLAAHSHGLSTHKHFHQQDPGWQSFIIRSPAPQDRATLIHALETIARTQPLLRVKGYASERETGVRLLLQGVRSRIEVRAEPATTSTKPAQLIFIGYHPSRPEIMQLLCKLTHTQWH